MTRVVQFSTGNVGRHALRAIIERPDLDLVGVHASSRDKVGRDAADLGVELDDVRERHEKWVTPEPIDCVMMRVEPGHVAAVRFGVDGMPSGKAAITMEHVNRLTEPAAPNWAYPPDGRPGVHRVVVDGSPGIDINTHVGIGLDHHQAG